MKNITLSAEENLIEKGRLKAANEKKSFNLVFRDWLKKYVGEDQAVGEYARLMQKFSYVLPGQAFSRENAHER